MRSGSTDSGTYNSLPYFMATGIVEVPFVAISSVIFCSVFYFLVGLQTARFPYFFVMYFFFQLYATMFGQAVAVWSPSLLVAQQIAPAIMSVGSFFLFLKSKRSRREEGGGGGEGKKKKKGKKKIFFARFNTT